MTDLGPDARSLLDTVRDGDEPSFEDAARIRSRVAMRVGVAAGVGAATALGAKGAGAAAGVTAAATSLTTKALLVIALTGAAGLAVAAIHSSSAPPSPPALAAAAATSLPARGAEPVALPVASASASASARAPALRRPAAPGPAPLVDTLLEESALLRSAHASLSSGDPATALARLDDHATRFPRSALSEDRAATRVHALCAQGRAAEARADAATFVAAHPRSALAPAVRRSCAEKP